MNDYKQELVKKWIVNTTFSKPLSNFIFAASFHRACVYFCLDFQTRKLSFWLQQARHGNISFILIITRLFKADAGKFSSAVEKKTSFVDIKATVSNVNAMKRTASKKQEM